MIIADTSGLLAYFDTDELAHEEVRRYLDGEPAAPVAVSPYVLAEFDYIVCSRRGVEIECSLLDELAGGAYDLVAMSGDDVTAAIGIIRQYRDQGIGLTDASLVVLADRYRTKTILTLDHRHFDVLRPLAGGRFKVVP